MKKFQFIPKSRKVIVTNNTKKIIRLASKSTVIDLLEDWLLEAQDGEYFNDENFEIICIQA